MRVRTTTTECKLIFWDVPACAGMCRGIGGVPWVQCTYLTSFRSWLRPKVQKLHCFATSKHTNCAFWHAVQNIMPNSPNIRRSPKRCCHGPKASLVSKDVLCVGHWCGSTFVCVLWCCFRSCEEFCSCLVWQSLQWHACCKCCSSWGKRTYPRTHFSQLVYWDTVSGKQSLVESVLVSLATV